MIALSTVASVLAVGYLYGRLIDRNVRKALALHRLEGCT